MTVLYTSMCLAIKALAQNNPIVELGIETFLLKLNVHNTI